MPANPCRKHIMKDKEPNIKPVDFVRTYGSRVGGQHKTKKQRITEALNELRLVVAGMGSGSKTADMAKGDKISYRLDSNEMVQNNTSLARAYALFLRKIVLGEGRNREARLLDDNVLESLEMSLQPLRRIPKENRREIENADIINGVNLILTRLDDETKEPQEQYFASGGEQGLSITVEWPLIGMADWTGPTTEARRWEVSPGQLFDTHSKRSMGCIQWLNQQVVIFNGKGITLEKMIRTIANLEAAHAVNVGRLMYREGEVPSAAARDPDIHILKNIALFGLGYVELVVIEAGMYLFDRLLKEPSIEKPKGPIYGVTHSFECSSEEAASSQPPWLQYRGRVMVSFSPRPGIEKFTVRAPN